MNAALVPVQRLGEGKSRLLGALERDDLDALTLAMLGDVLEALLAVPALDRVAVVTPDDTVARAAREAGAAAVLFREPGLNPALDAAAEALCGADDTLLVVLGDVAGAESAELQALFEALAAQDGRGVVLAPSADGGTAALLRAPADAIPNRFGAKSAEAHTAAAREADVPLRRLVLPSLQVDLDQREDLEALLAQGSGAPRTRALLERLGVGKPA